MRVLHITEVFEGGVGSHLTELLPLQVEELGHGQVHLLVDQAVAASIPSMPGVTVHSYRGRSSRLGSSVSIAGRARTIAREIRPDVVHAHSSFAGLSVRLPSVIPRDRQLIYCPHGWAFAQDVSPFTRHVYAWLERLLLNRTKGVICVSKHERDLAMRLGLPGDKLRVIPNGIADIPVIERNKRQMADGLAEDTIHFVFVGRFDRQKGIDILVKAARMLHDEKFHFHVVGKATKPEETIDFSGMDNISEYGWVSRDEVVRLFWIADAMIMPSRWEGLPIAGIEAFRSGLPVIASNCSALPELVSHGETGLLFEVDNPNALAESLKGLGRERLGPMGARARSTYEELYRIERQHRAIIDLYCELKDKASMPDRPHS